MAPHRVEVDRFTIFSYYRSEKSLLSNRRIGCSQVSSQGAYSFFLYIWSRLNVQSFLTLSSMAFDSERPDEIDTQPIPLEAPAFLPPRTELNSHSKSGTRHSVHQDKRPDSIARDSFERGEGIL